MKSQPPSLSSSSRTACECKPMTSPPSATRADQPHLVSLVLQSKKALQHGEQLCSKANALTNASAQCAVDVLALDAKVRWISEAVIEQLKVSHVTSYGFLSPPTLTQLAASVARSIEYKRAQLDKQIRVRCRPIPLTSRFALINIRQDWDAIRSERTSALDAVLESLGTQLVPPGFHQSSTDSSLFGSQHPLDKVNDIIDPTQSPSATVRVNVFGRKLATKHVDRSTWKTLRDFVDESAVEQVLDAVESDRARLDVRVLSSLPLLPSFFGNVDLFAYRTSCQRRTTTQRLSRPRFLLYATPCLSRMHRLRSSLCWFPRRGGRR